MTAYIQKRSSVIYVRELGPDDAEAVARIEARYHPPELRCDADAHRRHLSEALTAGVNFSFGLFIGERLVGYLLSFGFDPSIFPDQDGYAIYVEDVVIEPRFRRMLLRLFVRLRDEIVRHFPETSIEAHSVQSVVDFLKRHKKVFADIGAPLLRTELTGEIIGGEPRFRVRWGLAPETIQTVAPLDELLARLPGTLVEHDGRRFTVRLLQSEEYWSSLEPVWDQLLLRTAGHTVFQSYDYQRLWWNYHRGEGALYLVVLSEGEQLRGIAPLQIVPTQLTGRWLKELCYIGSRWEVDRPVMLFPEEAPLLINVLARFMTGRPQDWDLCSLYEQGMDDERTRALTDAFQEVGCLVGRSRDSHCPYLRLTGSSWQQLLAEKSQKFRKNLKAAGRKLQSEGALEYRVYTSAPEVVEQLEHYRDIEARSWKQKEGVGVSRSDHYFGFYRELAALFGRHNAFTVRMLSLDGKPVAGTFGLTWDGVYYSLQIAHDSAYDRNSPGTYLESLEIEECFRQELREYEFLGGFLNNKARWTTTFRETCQLHIYRRIPRLWALYQYYFVIKPPLKRIAYRLMKRQPQKDAV